MDRNEDCRISWKSVVNSSPAFSTEVQKPQFEVVTLAELLDKELPPRENVLAPWLPCQGLAMIHAPRGVGKTHIALGIAYAVACGGSFLKWHAVIPRNVLIIDGEMPAVVLQERLASIVKSGETEPQADIEFITPDFQSSRMPDLTREDDQAELEEVIANKELIIIDNISTLCRTGRENEAEGWLPVQEWALRMRATGKSVLFIHHSGKGGGHRHQLRGQDQLCPAAVGCFKSPQHRTGRHALAARLSPPVHQRVPKPGRAGGGPRPMGGRRQLRTGEGHRVAQGHLLDLVELPLPRGFLSGVAPDLCQGIHGATGLFGKPGILSAGVSQQGFHSVVGDHHIPQTPPGVPGAFCQARVLPSSGDGI